MKYILIPILALALSGCGHDPNRLKQTTEVISTDLTVSKYELCNPAQDSNTTVYEVRRIRGDHSLIVSIIYADPSGRLISLSPTPVSSDNISCNSGVFEMGWVSDIPVSELSLYVDRRGNISTKTVESHLTRESSVLRKRGTESVLVVDSLPLAHQRVQRRLDSAPPQVLTILSEQGAPVGKLLETLKQFAGKTKDIRMAMLPWDWVNTPTLIDETEGAPTKASTTTNQPALRTD